jgi:hypothetical protein
MALPTFDPLLHDIGLDGVGFMRSKGNEGVIQRQDQVPATARAAKGEGRYDTFQSESFIAQATFDGGLGQARFEAQDGALTGVSDTRWPGRVFPARKPKTAADGGTTSHYINRGTTLYGLTASSIETIGSATTQARTAGTVLHQPVTDGDNNVYWCQNNSGTYAAYRWNGTGAPVDITPNYAQPRLMARYGKWMWMLGRQTVESSITIVQSAQVAFGDVDQATISLTNVGKPGSMYLLYTWVQRDDGALVSMGSINEPGQNQEVNVSYGGNWNTRSTVDDKANSGQSWLSFRYTIQSNSELYFPLTVEFDKTVDRGAMCLVELEGIDQRKLFDFTDTVVSSHAVSGTSDTYDDSPATGTLNSAKEIVFAFVAAKDSTATSIGASLTPEGGWTEILEKASSAIDGANSPYFAHGVYKIVSATTSEQHTGTYSRQTGGGTLYQSHIVVSLYGSPLTQDIERFVLLKTSDDGTTWEPLGAVAATGIGSPIASYPAHGNLWFTTNDGLYRVGVEESNTSAGQAIVRAGIQQVDAWTLPYDTTNVGTWICSYGGLVFYNVGQTIRRFAPGSPTDENDNTVWPPPDWATVSGPIQSMVSGEGGVYFGAAGYLWCYNTRGFHALAAEPSANAFDTLFWHQGRLYYRGDPAGYFDFRYPSVRQDVVQTNADDVQVGYLVLSAVDFEKVNVDKIVRQFETLGYFTAGTNATESGTIALHYTTGTTGLIDPGKYGGSASSLTWTSIGTHSITDGGAKSYNLGTPLQAKTIFLRITLTPGTLGYPVLTGITAYGRAVMPPTTRIVAPILMATGQVDRQGNILYPTDADVKAAMDKLRALRRGVTTNGTNKYFTVNFIDENDDKEDYLVTAETNNDWLGRHKGATGMSWVAQFAMSEIP